MVRDGSINMLNYVVLHDDLVGEFESYPIAKYMWDRLTIRLDQIHSPLKLLRVVLLKRKKTKGNKEKNIARMKCYNCEKKGPTACDCLEPAKIPLFTVTPE